MIFLSTLYYFNGVSITHFWHLLQEIYSEGWKHIKWSLSSQKGHVDYT